jgi:hypothetical protein
MGVKSTVKLTREAAVQRAADLHQKRERRLVEGLYHSMADSSLEDELERLNDDVHGGEGFENYFICGDGRAS